MKALLPVALAALCTWPASAQEERETAAWEGSERNLSLRLGDRVLWTFHHDPDAPHVFFHPLGLPGTPALTVDAPTDHVWHHGLWFCWKYVDGVNYWEHARGSDRPAGRTRFSRPEIETGDDGSARIALAIEYAPGPDAEAVLAEERAILVAAPATDGSYAIDWTGRFTALAETVTLDRTPLPGEPGGRVYGGYAGLSLRMAQLQERVVTTTDGEAEFNEQDRLRTRSHGLQYGGVLDGREVAITVLSHPDNPRSPSPWYAIRSAAMTFCTPAVLCYGPMELKRDDTFTLRYRILVHFGRWDGERIADAVEEFADSSEPRKQTPHEGPDKGESK